MQSGDWRRRLALPLQSPTLESLRPELESFPVEAGSLAGPLLCARTVPFAHLHFPYVQFLRVKFLYVQFLYASCAMKAELTLNTNNIITKHHQTSPTPSLSPPLVAALNFAGFIRGEGGVRSHRGLPPRAA